MKKALEETAVQPTSQTGVWDDQSGPGLIHTAFSDDGIVHGTFANVLIDNTTESTTLMVVNYVILLALAALAFANWTNFSKSKSTVAVLGVGLSILGFLGSLGFAAIVNIKWNLITLWTLPFLLVGLGVDDMFIVHLAIDRQCAPGKDSKTVLGNAAAEVMAPVTLTSLTNFFMFLVMARSDLAGIYDTAYVAMISICFLWFLMVTTFPAIVAIDLSRQANKRGELCCFCTTVDESRADEGGCSILTIIARTVEPILYMPTITSLVGKLVVGIISLTFIIVGSVKMTDLPLGLDLNDFFVLDTWPEIYFQDRTMFFPFWPINMNFGKIEYHKPPVQLGMLKYWENAMEVSRVSGPSTSGFVWTSAMAGWAAPTCNHVTNPLITACGADLNPICRVKFYPNIYGSKLNTQGGVCLDFSADPSMAPFNGDIYAAFNFNHLLWTSAISASSTDAVVAADPLFTMLLGAGVQAQLAGAGTLAATPCNASTTAAQQCVGAHIQGLSDAAKAGTVKAAYNSQLRASALYPSLLNGGLQAASLNGGGMTVDQNDTVAKQAYTARQAALRSNDPDNFASYQQSGYSEFCPTLDLTPSEFAMCADLWLANDKTYGLINPNVKATGGKFVHPIKYSQVGGSSTYGIRLHTTDDYMALIRETRAQCDGAPTLQPLKTSVYDKPLDQLHCFMSGIPFDYWEQYLTIEDFLTETILLAALASVAVAVTFIFLELLSTGKIGVLKALQSATVGSVIIASIIAISVITVVGFMGWLEVELSGLTAMASLMTVGFASEFAVHITHKFLLASELDAAERAKRTMADLFLPTLLAFLSTLCGILLLLASDFGFVKNYVFKPLIVCILVTYFYGVWTLPVLLQCLHCVLPQHMVDGDVAPKTNP